MAITGFVHEYDHPASCFKPCDRDAGYHAHVMHVEKERERKREDGCGDST